MSEPDPIYDTTAKDGTEVSYVNYRDLRHKDLGGEVARLRVCLREIMAYCQVHNINGDRPELDDIWRMCDKMLR